MRKWIAMLLAAVIVLSLIPAPAPAAAASLQGSELEAQISRIYRTAQYRSGKASFNGYCGSLVSWQTHLLGIDKSVYGCDGKNQYDMYRNMGGMTTGGYRIKAYPAGQYDLRSALNTITKNGTVDAYNILVGFERTNTEQGSIYGHAMLIHGIVDGKVYFMECYSTLLGGQYWAEGTPIVADINTFCDYYNRWTVFEGVIHFGVKNYADLCQEFPSSMYAVATKDVDAYSEPEDPGVHTAERIVATLTQGEKVLVTGLLKTPGGSYWYRLEKDGQEAFAPADVLMADAVSHDTVTISDLSVPKALYINMGFVLQGKIHTQYGVIRGVEVAVYAGKETQSPMISGQMQTNAQTVSLNHAQLDETLTFRTLPEGAYRLVIRVQVESSFLRDGEVQTKTDTVQLWVSEMQIVTDWSRYSTVTFNGNGGEVLLQQTVIANGTALGKLPTATRPNYLMTGWTLDAAGTQGVTADTVINGNVTLYAQWKEDPAMVTGWQDTQQGLRYFESGQQVEGWFTDDGVSYYQKNDYSLSVSYQQVDGSVYYMSKVGARVVGWTLLDENSNVAKPLTEPGIELT